MMTSREPFVSVVTPFHDTEAYLKECIESVLRQSYCNFEYILVDNCSHDGSLSIAEYYAKRDSRIRIVRTSTFLRQLENYNHSLRQISNQSAYCKVVEADNWIYPNCLSEMISIARANPSVGIVAAYTLLDYGTYSKVYLTGLPYPGTVTKGRDVCRRFLLGENIVFGSPTTNLIRADIVRSHDPFYDEKSVIADVEVCFEALKASDFGFVHQVLSCTRRYNESIVSVLSQCCYWNLTELITIRKYGSTFLQKDEYRQRYRQVEREYWKALGEGILRGQPKDFLEYHRSNLLTIGDELDALKLGWGVLLTLSDLVLNPKETVERLLRYKQKTRTNNFGKIDQYYNMNV